MPKLYLLICTALQLACTNATSAQVSEVDTSLFLKIVQEVASKEQIVYVKEMDANLNGLENLKLIFQEEVIEDRMNTEKITLTKVEKEYLLSQVNMPTVWMDKLCAACNPIEADSVSSYHHNEGLKLRAAFDKAIEEKDLDTLKALTSKLSYVYYFFKPIYFRNQTVSLVSYEAICGYTCGHSEMSFYKKTNNQWTKWIIISEGAY